MPADHWLKRILDGAGCDNHSAEPGAFCDAVSEMVCASRIQAAEVAAAEAVPARHTFVEAADSAAGPMYRCLACGAWRQRRLDKGWLYSHDDGATWTPGPDPCPGRRP